jgi:hypothetical protein
MFRRSLLHRIAFLRLNRCSVLLAALCLFILLNPLVADSAVGALILLFWLLAILVLAVWALNARRLLRWVVAIMLLVAVEFVLTRHIKETSLVFILFATSAAFMGVVTVALLIYVLDWHSITIDKVFGAVAAYVLIAFTFASLFGLLQLAQPNAFYVDPNNQPEGKLVWQDMLYFSFTVLTSTGFGEITPATKMARSLIIIEQVLGVMYVAFLIARLANLYGRKKPD